MSLLVEIVVLCPVPLAFLLGYWSVHLVGTRCWPDEAPFHQAHHLSPSSRGGGKVQTLHHPMILYSMSESRSYVEEWQIYVLEMGGSLCGLDFETATETGRSYGHIHHHEVCVV